jgi:hypothetical protein
MADDFGKKVERFGQDVWKKPTDTVSTIGKKTSEAVGVIGKNADIAGKHHDLTEIYTEIGKQLVEAHAAEAGSLFPEQFEKVRQLKCEIDDLESQLLQQKGCRKCASCGEAIPLTVAFCPKCGAPQPKQDAEAEKPKDETEG